MKKYNFIKYESQHFHKHVTHKCIHYHESIENNHTQKGNEKSGIDNLGGKNQRSRVTNLELLLFLHNEVPHFLSVIRFIQ